MRVTYQIEKYNMRLDQFLTENGYAETRTKAKNLIESGSVNVNGRIIVKPAFDVGDTEEINCRTDLVCPYVSRGGLKLEGALREFGIDVTGTICLDIGASSGGFTDCLLKHGASKVYAVDSGTGQLHKSLQADSRVISLENVNARYLSEKEIPEKADVTVMDVSFISQTKLYPAIIPLVKDNGIFISLIKPQFEVGRRGVGKGGIVRDEKKRKEALENVISIASSFGLKNIKTVLSPIKGGDGNTEYLAYFALNGEGSQDIED